MVNYRRIRVPGGTYCFTVTLRDRRSDLLIESADLLQEVFRSVRQQHPFVIDAMVVLPDHLHTLWTMPEGDSDYSGRWRAIKARFSRALANNGVSLVRNSRGEYDVWQRRFWEHLIRDDDDFARRADYIHHNPVKHGLVEEPFDWRWSSIHAYARKGIIAADWRGREQGGSFGD